MEGASESLNFGVPLNRRKSRYHSWPVVLTKEQQAALDIASRIPVIPSIYLDESYCTREDRPLTRFQWAESVDSPSSMDLFERAESSINHSLPHRSQFDPIVKQEHTLRDPYQPSSTNGSDMDEPPGLSPFFSDHSRVSTNSYSSPLTPVADPSDWEYPNFDPEEQLDMSAPTTSSNSLLPMWLENNGSGSRQYGDPKSTPHSEIQSSHVGSSFKSKNSRGLELPNPARGSAPRIFFLLRNQSPQQVYSDSRQNSPEISSIDNSRGANKDGLAAPDMHQKKRGSRFNPFRQLQGSGCQSQGTMVSTDFSNTFVSNASSCRCSGQSTGSVLGRDSIGTPGTRDEIEDLRSEVLGGTNWQSLRPISPIPLPDTVDRDTTANVTHATSHPRISPEALDENSKNPSLPQSALETVVSIPQTPKLASITESVEPRGAQLCANTSQSPSSRTQPTTLDDSQNSHEESEMDNDTENGSETDDDEADDEIDSEIAVPEDHSGREERFDIFAPSVFPVNEGRKIITESLEELESQVIDRVMEAFRAMFDAKSPINARTCASDSQTPASQNYSHITTPNTSSSTKRGTKRSRDEDEPSKDRDQENSRKKPKSGLNNSATNIEDQRLACPYYKSDPYTYSSNNITENRYRTCGTTAFRNLHRVKEHLYRTHLAPIQCRRCWTDFKTDEELGDHMQAKVMCEFVEPNKRTPGVTLVQWQQLRSLPKKKGDDEEKWKKMYEILFPGKSVPSPFYERIMPWDIPALMSPGSEKFAEFETHLKDDVPDRVKDGLKRTLKAGLSVLQEQMVDSLPELIKDCIAQSAAAYQSRNLDTNALDSQRTLETDTLNESQICDNAFTVSDSRHTGQVSSRSLVGGIPPSYEDVPFNNDWDFPSSIRIDSNPKNPQGSTNASAFSDSGYGTANLDRDFRKSSSEQYPNMQSNQTVLENAPMWTLESDGTNDNDMFLIFDSPNLCGEDDRWSRHQDRAAMPSESFPRPKGHGNNSNSY